MEYITFLCLGINSSDAFHQLSQYIILTFILSMDYKVNIGGITNKFNLWNQEIVSQ